MTPSDLVPKYIINREGVLRDPVAVAALTDFGRSDDTNEALESGIKYLGKQFYGENLLLMATPDASGNLKLRHTSNTLPLDGQDADLIINTKSIDPHQSIMSRSIRRKQDELIRGELHQDSDYLEFSKRTEAVYSVPICRDGKVLGVFCIDSSDPSNFEDPRIMPMIHNFVELLVISLINTREEKARAVQESQAHLVELAQNRQRSEYAAALAAGWPLTPVLLQILRARPSSLDDLKQVFPRQDILGALEPLLGVRLVEYEERSFNLTTEGERLAAALRRSSSLPSYQEEVN